MSRREAEFPNEPKTVGDLMRAPDLLKDLKAGRLVVVPPVSVKPLEWQSTAWNHRSANIYVIEDMGTNWTHDRFWLAAHGILDNVGLGRFGTLEAAKAAAQADYEARILSALTASPDHTAGLIALVEGMGAEAARMKAMRKRLDHRIHCQRKSNRDNWEIVERRRKWIGSQTAQRAFIAMRARARAAEAERDEAKAQLRTGEAQYGVLDQQNKHLLARALAAEAKADALREALAEAIAAFPHIRDEQTQKALDVLRALTEQNNG